MLEQPARSLRGFGDRGAQPRRGPVAAKLPDPRAMSGDGVGGQVDAVDLAEVLAAVLEVVDHLQRGAQRVVGGPGRGAVLAVDVEHVAPDRHRRDAAVVDQHVPIGIAVDRDVARESIEEVVRVDRIEAVRGHDFAQRQRLGRAERVAVEPLAHPAKQAEFLLGRGGGVIGDVVGGAGEAVERHDRGAVRGLEQEARDREVLVAVALARCELGGR